MGSQPRLLNKSNLGPEIDGEVQQVLSLCNPATSMTAINSFAVYLRYLVVLLQHVALSTLWGLCQSS